MAQVWTLGHGTWWPYCPALSVSVLLRMRNDPSKADGGSCLQETKSCSCTLSNLSLHGDLDLPLVQVPFSMDGPLRPAVGEGMEMVAATKGAEF